MNTYLRSPMNYMGGKHKLLPQIAPLFPDGINHFVDLFTGGLTVALNVTADRTTCADLNTPMIELYREFHRRESEDVVTYVEDRIARYGLSKVNQAAYNTLRSDYNSNPLALDLFVLIAFAFNHQARFNTAGQFNTPFGKERSSFNPTMKANLIATVDRLKKGSFTFLSGDFRKVPVHTLDSGDFVYADPPYLISSGTYNDGTRGYGGWGVAEERALLDMLDRLHSQGVRWALSNVTHHKGAKNELLIKWADGYQIADLTFNYNNSNYQTGASGWATREVLITNYTLKGSA